MTKDQLVLVDGLREAKPLTKVICEFPDEQAGGTGKYPYQCDFEAVVGCGEALVGVPTSGTRH